MKQKIFVLVLLLFLTYIGGCYPYWRIAPRPQKAFHREDLLLAESYIPKNVLLTLEGEYLNNPEAFKQLKSGLVSLGFNFVEEQKIEALFIANCSMKLVQAHSIFETGKEYRVKVELINYEKNNVIWLGIYYGSSIGQSTDQVLRLLEKDIKLFNTKKEL